MTASNQNTRQVFLEVHSGLPREGPGNRESTERALAALGELSPCPRVLDIACGPGMQTIDLAELLPDATITAVEFNPPYVEAAQRRVDRAGCAKRVTVMHGDMKALPFEAGSFDLIWCEGAAYIMGVANALSAWRPLLAAGGRLAFTEAVWFEDDPPLELRDWWQNGYPDMGDVQTTLDRTTHCGYRILEHFPLPESAWWDDYYDPMLANIERLRERYLSNAAPVGALDVLDNCQMEIDYYQRFSRYYGYLFVVASV